MYDSVTTLFTKSELLTKRELIGRQRAKVQLLLRWAVTHTLKIKGAYFYNISQTYHNHDTTCDIEQDIVLAIQRIF